MNYTIENELLTLTAAEKGAELFDLRQKAAPGVPLLWDAGPAWKRRAPVCFPWCGRVEDNWYKAGGKRFQDLPQHGFYRDVDHVLAGRTGDSLTFRLDWPGDGRFYPWPFSIETRHTLEGNVAATVCTARNTGTEPMPIQIGFHTGLRCPFDPARPLEDYVIRFEKPEAPGGGDAFPLDRHSFDHDSLCLPGLRSEWAQVEEKDTGRYLRLDIRDFPYVLLWSAVGTPGFVCIEPWQGNVGPGHDLARRPGAVTLEPGGSYVKVQRLTVGL